MIKNMKIKKSVNLMTIKEIKSKFTTDQMLDMIKTFTENAEKISTKIRHSNNQFFAEVQTGLYELEMDKVRKLESIVY